MCSELLEKYEMIHKSTWLVKHGIALACHGKLSEFESRHPSKIINERHTVSKGVANTP
jgi:hypothetical protein